MYSCSPIPSYPLPIFHSLYSSIFLSYMPSFFHSLIPPFSYSQSLNFSFHHTIIRPFHHILILPFPHTILSYQNVPVDPRPLTCPVLVDTERTLAVLQGLRACHMVQSLSVSPEEEGSEKWLSADIFSGGFEIQPEARDEHPVRVQPSFSRQLSVDVTRVFIAGLVNPDVQDENVASFLALLQRYSRHRNLTIPITDQTVDHPVEHFGRLYLACFIKLHDLVPTALRAIEQESNSPDNELDPSAIHLPPPLPDVCKVVFDTKILLVKARQESSCSYEEVCREPIARCHFILDNVRSPLASVTDILHRNRIQVFLNPCVYW